MHWLTAWSELSVGLFSSAQPNPPNNWPNPTQPTARWTYRPMIQPNPYPTKPSYIEQQLACRKKISLCTSCHHHHPNAHRNNANTHIITSITVIRPARNHQRISSTDSTFSADSYIYTRHVFFAHLPFQTHDPTQPTKNTNFRPIPDPTQPNARVNPTHGHSVLAWLIDRLIVTWQDGGVSTTVAGEIPVVRSIVRHVSIPSAQSARSSRCYRSSASAARCPSTWKSCQSPGSAVPLGTGCFSCRDTSNLCTVVRQHQWPASQSVSIFSFQTKFNITQKFNSWCTSWGASWLFWLFRVINTLTYLLTNIPTL